MQNNLEKPMIQISKVQTPHGEDINSLIQSHEPEVLNHLLNERISAESPAAKGVPKLETSNSAQRSHEHDQKSKLDVSNPELITYERGYLKCSLLGGINMQQTDRLRVTLLLERVPKLSPLHSVRQSGLDLYNDNFLQKFTRSAAEKLEYGTSEIRLLLAHLIEELETYRFKAMENKRNKLGDAKPRVLTPERRKAALEYLKQDNLLKQTNIDIGKSGVIGEEVNRLLMYLCFTSRLREQPLHMISLGASGTGKTYLQEKVAELIPEQDQLEITMLSDNAFYYFKQKELKHKLILIEDMDGLSGNNTGSNGALLALRELMSKKRINKRVVSKDAKGNMQTISLLVEGPICVAGTTTKERVYEDNANRSLLIYRDNSSNHFEKVMDYQRRYSAGTVDAKTETEIKELFKDMQTLFKPVSIRNPFAQELKIPQEVFKPLRTNTHYLQFIECVTFYHQFQRELKVDEQTGETYIETTLEDIAAANALLKDVLLAKADEISGACRKFFERLKSHLKESNQQSFYGKEIRKDLRLSYPTLKRHLLQLTINGYLKVVGGDKFRKGYEYEVVSYEEYQQLKSNIITALDQALEKIKSRSSVDQSGSKV